MTSGPRPALSGLDQYTTYKALTRDLSATRSFRRASIVPYYLHDGERHYFLGVDAKYGTLTTLGGSIHESETFLEAAVRELKEESMGLFDFTHDLKHISEESVAIYDHNTILLLQPIAITDPTGLCRLFRQRYLTATHTFTNAPACTLENSNLVWIADRNLRLLVEDRADALVLLPAKLREVLHVAVVPPHPDPLLYIPLVDEYPIVYNRDQRLLVGAYTIDPNRTYRRAYDGDLLSP